MALRRAAQVIEHQPRNRSTRLEERALHIFEQPRGRAVLRRAEGAQPIKNLAVTYQKIVLAQTAVAPEDEMKPLYGAADASVDSIKQACG